MGRHSIAAGSSGIGRLASSRSRSGENGPALVKTKGSPCAPLAESTSLASFGADR
jgi:hypothetical protein